MSRNVEHVLEQSYTARDLIAELQNLDPEARILFVCSYGDYPSTQQALPVGELAEFESDVLHESGYSDSGIAFTDPNAEPEPDGERDEEVETFPIVILQAG